MPQSHVVRRSRGRTVPRTHQPWRHWIALSLSVVLAALVGLHLTRAARAAPSATTASGAVYALADPLGSVRQLTAADGSVVRTQSYGAAGQVRHTSGSVAAGLGFTGEPALNDCLTHLRARVLNHCLGTFLTRDSLDTAILFQDDPSAANRVAMLSNPVMDRDPSGHAKVRYSPYDWPTDPVMRGGGIPVGGPVGGPGRVSGGGLSSGSGYGGGLGMSGRGSVSGVLGAGGARGAISAGPSGAISAGPSGVTVGLSGLRWPQTGMIPSSGASSSGAAPAPEPLNNIVHFKREQCEKRQGPIDSRPRYLPLDENDMYGTNILRSSSNLGRFTGPYGTDPVQVTLSLPVAQEQARNLGKWSPVPFGKQYVQEYIPVEVLTPGDETHVMEPWKRHPDVPQPLVRINPGSIDKYLPGKIIYVPR